tara:strand:- start:293 stop:553 length:261 start_codon:yes stop_codon:yes gene_type:complete
MKIGVKLKRPNLKDGLKTPTFGEKLNNFKIFSYFCCTHTSLITGIFAQSPHLVFCTIQPSSRTSTSTTLSHLEQVEEIVSPHFLQL